MYSVVVLSIQVNQKRAHDKKIHTKQNKASILM